MLLRRALPNDWVTWNERWHAPQGPDGRTLVGPSSKLSKRKLRALGPFVWQPNSTTRRAEYPWAFHTAKVRPGERVLEIGGALSGLQWVLAAEGATVTNVDPFVDYGSELGLGDPVDLHRRINEIWGTDVELIRSPLGEAGVAPGSVDLILSISALEHFEPPALADVLCRFGQLLRPGGRAVLTLDLFINLEPFSRRPQNQWGRNVMVTELVEMSGLELTIGDPKELFGYPEFDSISILGRLEEFAMGADYPHLAQAIELTKPRDGLA